MTLSHCPLDRQSQPPWGQWPQRTTEADWLIVIWPWWKNLEVGEQQRPLLRTQGDWAKRAENSGSPPALAMHIWDFLKNHPLFPRESLQYLNWHIWNIYIGYFSTWKSRECIISSLMSQEAPKNLKTLEGHNYPHQSPLEHRCVVTSSWDFRSVTESYYYMVDGTN